MATLNLTTGEPLLVDDQDVPLLEGRALYAIRCPHTTYATLYAGKQRASVHRLIMSPIPPGVFVDHINGNGLDCRRANLRLCTKADNAHNRRRQAGSSRYKGVRRKGSRWAAQISHAGRRRHLGYYDSEDDAARAYDLAARELFGAFAWLNFPHGFGSAPPQRRQWTVGPRCERTGRFIDKQ